MVNRVAKGSSKELEAKKILEAQGYIVWKTIRHKFLNIDLFGNFDILAIKGMERIYIQIKSAGKTNSNIGEKSINTIVTIKGTQGISIEDFVKNNKNPYEKVQIWIYVAGRWRGRGNEKHYQQPIWNKWEVAINGLTNMVCLKYYKMQ